VGVIRSEAGFPACKGSARRNVHPPYPLVERLEKTRLFMSLKGRSRQSHGRDLR